MKLETATVVSQEELYEDTFLMWLDCPPVARAASAGRFLMIHCSEQLDPLLPRPMSFHRFRESGGVRQFAILYDVRGRGTTWLSHRKAGDTLTLFGPLGRGYEVDPGAQNMLLVAGGLGVAAVVTLADDAVTAGKNVTLLQGARTAAKIFPADSLPHEVEIVSATDDGSEGHHGRVTDLLAQHLPWADQIFACGPNPMFESMARVMKDMRTRKPVQALLEEHMGCGTGVCYGCAVFTRKGVRLVCRDGPRMELREVFG
ncbi:MAG TPA: dihydroorotate dehydrogenase electron transfer subunit [Dehalococcoidia bacterium]|nr:dihydroorotate dehydrogenase electron transfer subunit [Dehalococcoidia bacterium]